MFADHRPLNPLKRTLLPVLVGLSLACTPQQDDGTDADPAVEISADAHLRRLPPSTYERGIAQVFGVPLTTTGVFQMPTDDTVRLPRVDLIPDVAVHGQVGQTSGQTLGPAVIEAYQRNAQNIAPVVLTQPSLLACTPEALEGSVPCAQDTLAALAPRLLRRPLSDDESTRLRTLVTQLAQTVGPTEAVVVAIEGLLQSPQFLYLPEPGTEGAPLTGHQIAARLAVWLWDSVPDDALLAKAAAGDLDTAEGVRAAAAQMLDDPRARHALTRFHMDWVGADEVLTIRPDRAVWDPTFDAGFADAFSADLQRIKSALQRESELLIEHVLFTGTGTLTELLTTSDLYTSAPSAQLNGVAPTDATGLGSASWEVFLLDTDVLETFEAVHVTAPAGQRAGLLTLPAVMAANAHAVHPAPVLRGKLLLERVLCDPLDPPPPNAEASAPPQASDAALTNRARHEQSTGQGSCAACHDQLNPLGFAFENYDALGAWRDEDFGQPIDSTGSLTTSRGASFTFDNAVDLATQLAAHPQVQDCYVSRWAEAALGRPTLDAEADALAQVQASFRAGDGTVRELLLDLAASDLLRLRRGGF